jgi:hypothetical protein
LLAHLPQAPFLKRILIAIDMFTHSAIAIAVLRFFKVLAFLLFTGSAINAQPIKVKAEYASMLQQLADALITRQIVDKASHDAGAIQCQHCKVLHTRAAEAVYPFSVLYGIKKDERWYRAAVTTAAWLIQQQEEDGSWKETPEEWKGTTTDQLLMLLLAYEKISFKLTEKEQLLWKTSMKKAARYLHAVMTPEFASINYVATTSATLAKAGELFQDTLFTNKARLLARRTVSKMDEDGFLNGEGGRSHGNKMGVDLGYDMEMSLWGLGLYAKVTGDTLVDDYVKMSLKNHLYFIYPDGSLDASWGIRSNKWTGYGSATSDGCQVLFSLYADADPRYASASIRNLRFIKENMVQDLIGYGLHHQAIFDTQPCIYPTFAKAKNIALAYELENKETREPAALPTDQGNWIKAFPTIDVVEVRTQYFMATVTGYRYKDPAGAKGKYMFRPSGGALSHLWMKNVGFLQASSPTIYTRPEPMSFPEAPGILCLTPRIEYEDSTGYFSNLFEFDSRLFIDSSTKGQYAIKASGELKDKNQLTGGVGYRIAYLFADSFYEKTIHLNWHDSRQPVTIVEPFIQDAGTTFEKADDQTVLIRHKGSKIKFTLLSRDAKVVIGRNRDKYWAPYPALKAFPIEIEVGPRPGSFTQVVRYQVSVAE